MTDGSAPLVSVVVPVLNGERTIDACLTSLLRMDFPAEEREIVVVYQPSGDRTLEILRRHPVRIVVEERRGLGYARNAGIEASRGRFVASTDADCLASRRWLAELMDGFSDGVAAVAGEVVSFPPRTPVERYAAMRKPLWAEWTRRGRRRPWFLFGSAAVRRDAFSRVGLFDTAFAGGSEDIDLCWRFHEAGLRTVRRPRAVAFHHHRVTRSGLWRQHVGYGKGQARLRRKYPEEAPWGWGRELRAWADLGMAAWNVGAGYARRLRHRDEMAFYYPYFDFVRKLAQRTGFARAALGSTADARPTSAAEAFGAETLSQAGP